MWRVYRPCVERLEQPDSEEPRLAGLPDDLDSVIDPDYSETNRSKQLRDGLLWAALEWARVVRDTAGGPVANLDAASTPPPNSWAIAVLSTYALGGLDKRRDLISRAMTYAATGDDPPGGTDPEEEAEGGDGGYLDML